MQIKGKEIVARIQALAIYRLPSMLKCILVLIKSLKNKFNFNILLDFLYIYIYSNEVSFMPHCIE